MKKIIAIFLIIALISLAWWSGYSVTHNLWLGLLFMLIGFVLSGVGALCVIFIVNAFSGKK